MPSMFGGACSLAVLAAVLLELGSQGVTAYEVVGQITGSQQLAPDFLNTRVVLNDGLYSAFVTASGHFKIDDVPAGVYHLDVYEPKLKFRKYKVDVSSKKGGTIRALSKPFPGGEKKLESYPLIIQPQAPEVYFRERTASNPIAMIFRNPIFLIMGVFAVLKLFAGNLTAEEDGAEKQNGAQRPELDADGADDDDDDMPALAVETKQGSAPRRRRGKRD